MKQYASKSLLFILLLLASLISFSSCKKRDGANESNSDSDNNVVSAIPHTHIFGEWHSNTATCTENGSEKRNCTYTGCDFFEERDTHALLHNYENGVCTLCGTAGKYSEDLEYTLSYNGKSYSVSGIGYCYDADIIIPPIYNGLPVVQIRSKAFFECDSILSVTIPNSITSISDDVFYNCSNLESVILGNSISSIGDYAFEKCSSLKNINIPQSVTSIGQYAFRDCTKLESIELPDSITKIDSYTFKGCTNLKSVTLPNALEAIYYQAFYRCENLTSIEIPPTLIGIGIQAFNGCENLESVYIKDLNAWCRIIFEGYGTTQRLSNPLCYADKLYLNGELITDLVFPDGIIAIGDYSFNGYSGLNSVTISDSVRSIGFGAFLGCDNLTNVTIGDSVSTINSGAFYECKKLVNVTLGKSVSEIYSFAFSYCYSLANIYYKGTSEEWSISVDSNNTYFTDATRYYYSETAPTEEGNYWYYDQNREIATWEHS